MQAQQAHIAGLQGLENLGSTCAINSLIQLICRTPHLRNAILDSHIEGESLASELREILDMMHNKQHSISPKKFVNHLYRHFDGIFEQGEQIDIGELWMFLCDKIATELGTEVEHSDDATSDEIANIDIIDNHQMAANQGLHRLCKHSMNRFNNNKISKWQEMSQGIMLHILTCNNCNNIIYNFEPFISIPVDIPSDSGIFSIAAMLRNYLKSQTCSGDWKCDKCKVPDASYTKLIKLWKMPPVLIFIVKRFANIHMKNTQPISINKTISVKRGSIIADIDEEYIYNCTALGYHFGSLFGGHYCALCKNEGGVYLLYDDLNINIVNEDQIKKAFEESRDAYMVVYTTEITR
jgi:ubiquitin C-terminal hydrolase